MCSNCKIVINEVLVFVQNKIEVMDEVSIIQICTSAFTEEEIYEAKSLLFKSLPLLKRKMSRKKERKPCLEEIIAILKEIEPDSSPIFVARRLEKLPPVSFDHVDVTRLLKDIVLLKSQTEYLKQNCVTSEQFTELRDEVNNLKSESVHKYEGNINIKRGGYSLDSGPVGLCLSPAVPECERSYREQQLLSTVEAESSRRACSPSHSRNQSGSASTSNTSPVQPVPAQQIVKTNDNKRLKFYRTIHKETTDMPTVDLLSCNKSSKVPVHKISMAEVVKMPGEWKKEPRTEEWINVQRRKLRNRFIGKTGKATTELEGKFKAADIKMPLFVSNVHKDVSEEDIIKYIRDKTGEIITIEKVVIKENRDYNAYKAYVSKNRLSLFLDENIWPDGISFRRFVHFRKHPKQDKASQIKDNI